MKYFKQKKATQSNLQLPQNAVIDEKEEPESPKKKEMSRSMQRWLREIEGDVEVPEKKRKLSFLDFRPLNAHTKKRRI